MILYGAIFKETVDTIILKRSHGLAIASEPEFGISCGVGKFLCGSRQSKEGEEGRQGRCELDMFCRHFYDVFDDAKLQPIPGLRNTHKLVKTAPANTYIRVKARSSRPGHGFIRVGR